MTRTRRYTIILHPEEGGFWVSVSALPGCYSQANTIAQAIERAQEAIACHIEALSAKGEPVPEESEHPQAVVVDVAA